MPPLRAQDAVLFVVLAALLVAGWLREQRRARAGETELSAPVRTLFLLASMGGGFGALIWFVLMPNTWPWLMPSLATRFLSAAAAAFALGCAIALWRGRWPEARLFLVVSAGYFAPLLVTLPLHLDRFNFLLPVTWGFLMTGAGMFVLAIWELVRTARRPFRTASPPQPAWIRALVALVGVLSLVLGLLMLVAPETATLVWPWVWEVVEGGPIDVDGLTNRLIAVMFLGLAAGAAFTLAENRRDVGEVFLAMVVAYALLGALGVGLFVAHHPTTPSMYLYLAGLVSIALAALLALQPSDVESHPAQLEENGVSPTA